ncbi:hypothetical protein UFOVP654_67 [uncultured Caudovirales phage]|uniref:Uncharacterized protein n=1 Tax=uncultured Caudovirales phage TaxID=2100421 RepID=A0A6J5N692_9CAUD|nr:hypothetical protein UFOVP654_67 [uncultured Caudovirales phage]
MNNEQVMQLMADNGMHEGGMDNWVIDNAWVKFANLVAAQEREECIRVCMESNVQAMDFTGGTYVGGYFANAIKQRGETK